MRHAIIVDLVRRGTELDIEDMGSKREGAAGTPVLDPSASSIWFESISVIVDSSSSENVIVRQFQRTQMPSDKERHT